VSAASKGRGNSRPRRDARRRIPLAAFGLKKYLRGTGRVSKTSDNEHATAALGDSEVLSVQHSVGEPIPESPQVSEDGSKRPPSVDRQEARDVLEDDPTGSKLSHEPGDLPVEIAALVVSTHAAATSCHGERLAGESSGDDSSLGNKASGSEVIGGHGPHVVEQGHVREVVAKDAGGLLVDLDGGDGSDTDPFGGEIEAADAGEQGDEGEAHDATPYTR
jgi:hypothetical protein